MNQRELDVIALLTARFDWVPVPTARFQDLAKRGEAKETWVLCQRCAGRKTVGNGKASRPCDRCQGEGRVLVDPMTVDARKSGEDVLRERVTGEAASEKTKRQKQDWEIRRLKLAAEHRKGLIDPSEKEAWERAKASLYASGSFLELDKALQILERESAYDRQALEVVYGYDSPLRTVGAALQTRADMAVTALARLMPVTIRVPVRALSQSDEARLLARQGVSQMEIARRLGVSQPTVSRILSKAA